MYCKRGGPCLTFIVSEQYATSCFAENFVKRADWAYFMQKLQDTAEPFDIKTVQKKYYFANSGVFKHIESTITKYELLVISF